MSRKCSYKGGNLLKQKVQFKQQILLAQPKDIQGLKGKSQSRADLFCSTGNSREGISERHMRYEPADSH